MKTSSGSGAHSPPSSRITVSTGASARAGPWISTIPPSSRADERPHVDEPLPVLGAHARHHLARGGVDHVAHRVGRDERGHRNGERQPQHR